MRPSQHLIISAAVSLFISFWVKSWIASIACFLSGVLIDIDHHLDYYLARKKFPQGYRDLVVYCTHDVYGKLYLILHSYENLFLLSLLIYYFPLNPILIGILIGAGVHIFCDQFSNPLKPLAYFFIYRFKNGFERKKIFQKEYFQKIS